MTTDPEQVDPEAVATRLEATAALLADTVVRNSAFVPVQPTAQQWTFLADTRREVMYGGSAGCGKSSALLIAALQYVHVPGYRALILRRTFSDLALPGALMDMADGWLSGTGARKLRGGREWVFPSGATLTFGYLATDAHRTRYQGAAFHFVGWDELTTFTEAQYLYLFSRARRPSSDTDGASGVPIRVRSTSNPGGVGHEFVKARFVDPQPPETEAHRGFVPALLTQNPHLDVPAYRAMLANLDPVTRLQLEHGDWDVAPAGNFFRPSSMPLADAAELIGPTTAVIRVRAWDLAATEGRGDWSAGVLVAWLPGHRTWLVEDVVRVRQEPGSLERTIRATAERDGRTTPIVVEQEGGSSGKMAARDLRTRVLAGFPVSMVSPSGSKLERARLPAASAANGDVRVARAPWNAAFLDELAAFPAGPHDDQVDALAYAFHAVARTMGQGFRISVPTGSREQAIARGPSLPQTRRRIVRASPTSW